MSKNEQIQNKEEIKDEIIKKQKVQNIDSINKWWEKDDDKDDDIKWMSLEHHGVEFPLDYQRHNKIVRLKENKQKIELNMHQEEIVTYWCQSVGSEWENKSIYKNNFNKMFIESLNKEQRQLVKSVDDLDLSEIIEHLIQQRELKKNRTIEQKKELKEQKEKQDQYYGYALVDGVLEKVGGYLIEAPTLFKGRGEHPKAGLMKARILPEDICINIDRQSAVPKCNMKGHCWKDIVHNDEVTWLAFYKDDTINTNYKYIFLSAASKFKGLNDRKKYEKARTLKLKIDQIRQNYKNKMIDENQQNQQLGTACYFIDKFALRVGNEKSEDEADTVGCCSLRIEHIKLQEDNYITLDFLGKDSMRYYNTIQVEQQVYQNLVKFIKGKEQQDDLFEKINATTLNDYLRSMMQGLTAKVFRTYNASITLEQELNKSSLDQSSLESKVDYYDNANKQVAILCNHQKTVNKNFDNQIEKQELKIQFMKEYRDELHQLLKKNSAKQLQVKEEIVYLTKDQKEQEKKSNQFIKKFPATIEKVQSYIEQVQKKINQEEQKLIKKEGNKNIALGTSKINYNDPRITVVWCKNNEVPIEKVFTKNLRQKFPWAMYIEPNWKF